MARRALDGHIPSGVIASGSADVEVERDESWSEFERLLWGVQTSGTVVFLRKML